MHRIRTIASYSRGYTGDRGRRRSQAMTLSNLKGRSDMMWTTPVIVEICIGLEINGYLPTEL
jgi:coenzyme PQQ precursor peptide PqqA